MQIASRVELPIQSKRENQNSERFAPDGSLCFDNIAIRFVLNFARHKGLFGKEGQQKHAQQNSRIQ